MLKKYEGQSYYRWNYEIKKKYVFITDNLLFNRHQKGGGSQFVFFLLTVNVMWRR